MGFSLLPATSLRPMPGGSCPGVGSAGRSTARTRRKPRWQRAPIFSCLAASIPTPSHPGLAGAGTALLAEIASLDRPVIAIGGITPERVPELKAAGAYGVAAIRALWQAPDPAAATLAMLAPWVENT